MSGDVTARGSGLMRRAIIMLCLVAACMSVWLSIQKLTGGIDSLAGCGAGSGCANVLGSKWSVVFEVIPVSVFSALLYIAVLGSLWCDHRTARWFRVFAAFLMIGAAVWFTVLQLIVMKTICPYCMGMHSFGVLLAILLLAWHRKGDLSLTGYASTAAMAVASVLALAAIQHWGKPPATHRVDSGVVMGGSHENGKDDDALASHPHTGGEGRLVSFFDGKKSFRVGSLPHIGSEAAPHVIVKYYDYTCSACHDMHDYVKQLQSKYPGKLTVIVLPVPIERACNPHLPVGVKDHANACAYAKLSLRVWLADASMFSEFHSWLFEYHGQPYEVAEAMAYSLISEDKMAVVSDALVDELLAANIEDYRELVKKTPVMPKILLKGSAIMQGVSRDVSDFEAVLSEHLGLGE